MEVELGRRDAGADGRQDGGEEIGADVDRVTEVRGGPEDLGLLVGCPGVDGEPPDAGREAEELFDGGGPGDGVRSGVEDPGHGGQTVAGEVDLLGELEGVFGVLRSPKFDSVERDRPAPAVEFARRHHRPFVSAA